MTYPTVYISVTDEKRHLTIDGNLELFNQFIQSLGSKNEPTSEGDLDEEKHVENLGATKDTGNVP